MAFLPGLYKPLDEKTFHDGFVAYFTTLNEYALLRQKEGSVDSKKHFNISKIVLMSELAREQRKAPGG